MKTLYLMRHGKSSWEDLLIQDYERPLLAKGIRRTRRVATYMATHQIVPQLIIASHATRAHETAIIVAQTLEIPSGEIVVDENLYFSGQEAMYNIVFGLDDQLDKVMLVGHNPDMTSFANVFMTDKIDYLPTSALVGVQFQTDKWHEIVNASYHMEFFITPSGLKS